VRRARASELEVADSRSPCAWDSVAQSAVRHEGAYNKTTNIDYGLDKCQKVC